MAEPYLKELSRTITELDLPTSDDVVLECKHFFSGAALYANGKICTSLTPAGFALKLPAEVRERLMQDGEGKALRYFEGAPVKREYVVLPEAIAADQARLKALLVSSIDYVVGQ
jgi:TfoX/Sxy family transcriptional regulator of competence genes